MIEEDKIIILKQDVNAQTIMYEQIAESKLNTNYEFITVNSGEEALQQLVQLGSGCLLFSISTKKELQELAIVMKRLKKDIKNNLFKISGYNNIINKKVTKFLKDHHVTEIFETELNLKSIEFKFNLWFKSITSARGKYVSVTGNDLVAPSEKKRGEKLDGKLKGSTAVKNPVKYLAPLSLHSDCFIFVDKKHAKNIMNSWIIEIVGPGPASGRWHDITSKSNSTTPIWKWEPTREDLFTFILDDGYWIFKGREPIFSWESNRWKLSGNSPELIFYTDKPNATKFYIENNQLHITKTSEQAKAKLSMLKESFDPKYSISHDNIVDKEEGTGGTDKIDMFYKGENEGKTEELTDHNTQKTSNYKDDVQTENLTGKSGDQQPLEDHVHQQKTSMSPLSSDESMPSKKELAALATRSNAKKSKGFQESLDDMHGHQGKGIQENLGDVKNGKGSTENQSGNLSSESAFKESIDKQAYDRTRAQAKLDKAQKNSKSSSPELEDSLDDDELEKMKEDLLSDIKSEEFNKKSKELSQNKPGSKKEATAPLTRQQQKRAKAKKREKEEEQKKERERKADQENQHTGSLSGVLDAPVDLGDQNTDSSQKSNENLDGKNTDRSNRRSKNNLGEDEDGLNRNSAGDTKSKTEGQFGQHNDAIKDEHGDIQQSDKDWEKYYRGGNAKKDKEKKENTWGGPSGNKNSFNQKGKGRFGEQGEGANDGKSHEPLSGKLSKKNEVDKAEKKKAFDEYMASLKPKEAKERKDHGPIGLSNINFNSVKMDLQLKTQSKKGQLFDVSEETELLDLIDNIIVVKNISRKTYALHTQMLLQCYVHYSNKEYDFTVSGRLTEIEGEDGEILNLELTKYNADDLENLLILFSERQNNIVNFINTAQGKA